MAVLERRLLQNFDAASGSWQQELIGGPLSRGVCYSYQFRIHYYNNNSV